MVVMHLQEFFKLRTQVLSRRKVELLRRADCMVHQHQTTFSVGNGASLSFSLSPHALRDVPVVRGDTRTLIPNWLCKVLVHESLEIVAGLGRAGTWS